MNKDDSQLGFAGKLAKTFINSKLTLLLIIAILLVGAASLVMTPREYNPQITVPAANIMLMKPGSNTQEVHNLMVKPMEALMNALPGVDHTYGMAQNDFGMVTVAFKVGEDQERSLVRVYNQIMQNMDLLPVGAMQPLVKPINVDDVPIFSLAISSSQMSESQLREVASSVLEKLRTVPGVSIGAILGAKQNSVQIQLDPLKMQSMGLSLNQLDRMLRASNVDLPAGEIIQNNQAHPIRLKGALASQGDIKDLVVGNKQGRAILLQEVATITEGPLEEDLHARYTQTPQGQIIPGLEAEANSISITLAKKAGTNAVKVSQAIEEKLEAIRMYSLPETVNISVTRNDGKKANAAVNLLVEHLGIAIITVVFILVLFLGWREAAIVTLTVPLILLIVLSIGYFSGQSINRITLFALILALGLLVDDSIVVIENIHRHLHGKKHKSFSDAIVAATDEIGNPTNIATIAVMLAFLPMAFVSGMMGPFMMPIPFNVPVAMIASLMIAYITVPWISRRWLKAGHLAEDLENTDTLEEQGMHQEDVLHRLYVRYFTPFLSSRRLRFWFISSVSLAFGLAMLQPSYQFFKEDVSSPLSPLAVDLKMLPYDNSNSFLIELNTPDGTPAEETDRIAREVGEILYEHPQIMNYQTFLGLPAPIDFAAVVRGDMMRRGSHFAQIRINLTDKHDRSKSSHEIAQEIHESLNPIHSKYPQMALKIFEEPPGPPVQSQIMAEVYGPDQKKNIEASKKIEELFKSTYGMINVDRSVKDSIKSYQIVIDRQKALSVGVVAAQVAQLLHQYMNGLDIGVLINDSHREATVIRAKLPNNWKGSTQIIMDLRVQSSLGTFVPLGEIASLDSTMSESIIFTRDQHSVVRVTGELIESSPAYAVLGIDHKIDGVEIVSGYQGRTSNLGFVEAHPQDLSQGNVLWGGEMRLTLDTFRDMGSAFLIALVLIYLLLVGYYKDFVLPVIVMGPIPLTMIGVFPGHWITGQAFTATSMIGVIALAGIVVRNSLLLIDFILEYRKEGHDLKESVIEAGAARFRPIVLTALAIIMASAIMITDPVFGGLAVSLIFGTFIATALTLVVIPLIYYFMELKRGLK